jgi:iron complex transport system ATP-binding protein
MLKLSNLAVTIDKQQLLAINEFTAEATELVAVVGKNGAGKSTFFKSIVGEITATGGRYFHQLAITDWPKQRLARHLAVLPQSSLLTFPFTVSEVVALGLIPLTISRRQGLELVRQKLALTDTERFANRSYLALSGGERQRVHLARILVQLSQAKQAPLILLDEPTSAQDIAQQHHCLQLVQALCHEQGYGALVIMHDLNLSMRYADKVCLLGGGSMVAQGTPAKVLTPATIKQQWGYLPQQVTTANGVIGFL